MQQFSGSTREQKKVSRLKFASRVLTLVVVVICRIQRVPKDARLFFFFNIEAF